MRPFNRINPDDYDFKKSVTTPQTFRDTNYYVDQRDDRTITITQVGDFFEIYSLIKLNTSRDEDPVYLGSRIEDFADACDLNIVEKNSVVINKHTKEEYQLMMAGFKRMYLDRYVQKLLQKGFDVAVITQERDGENAPRSLSAIYSVGTTFVETSINEIDISSITNNTMCILIEENKDKEKGKKYLTIGVSTVDIYTGKSKLFEYTVEDKKSPVTYDELERIVSVNSPSELIFISHMNEDDITDILSYINIKSRRIHKINITDEKVVNCLKQKYQRSVFSNFFTFDNFSIFISSFYENPVASQSLCYLLDFIYEHNPNLIKKISSPKFESFSDRVILNNYSLRQLNILDNGDKKDKSQCIQRLLNDCFTPMGRRYFNEVFLNPIINEEVLNREYNIIEHISTFTLENVEKLKSVTSVLKTICDLEKLGRYIMTKRITPSYIFKLYKVLLTINFLFLYVDSDPVLKTYFIQMNNYIESRDVEEILNFLRHSFFLENCKCVNKLSNFNENVVNPDVDEKLKNFIENSLCSMDKLEACRNLFNDMIEDREGGRKNKVEYVRIHETERNGVYLLTTNVRSKLLLDALEGQDTKRVSFVSSYTKKREEFILSLKDIYVTKHSQTNVSINSVEIDKLCSSYKDLEEEKTKIINEVYGKLITKLETYYTRLLSISSFVTLLDFIFCKAGMAVKYNYVRPQIEKRETSFIKVKNLRHPVVEINNVEEIFVANDVELDGNGMLIYGCNFAGKSTLIKAVGVSLIMAQAGMFVPASSFIYCPYTQIFTRILNNDNIFKGLSTFVVEVLELKNILENADKRSLIIGDELTSSTEGISGKSIFVAGLQELTQKRSTFLFATHMHEIVSYDEVDTLVKNGKLLLKHMTVFYDIRKDKLIYERKLRDGRGSSIYGLEVCKSLSLPDSFITTADMIRKKYFSEAGSILEYDISRYNSEKVVGICERCKNRFSTEVHHEYMQKDADSRGFITTEDGRVFHKNHPSNLISVCEECHLEIHRKHRERRINREERKKEDTSKHSELLVNPEKKKSRLQIL
jgi:DNA mismatch repair protein MutS